MVTELIVDILQDVDYITEKLTDKNIQNVCFEYDYTGSFSIGFDFEYVYIASTNS